MKNKFIKVLEQLGEEYQLTKAEMFQLLKSNLEVFEPVDGFPKYERHGLTGVIRNRNTRRILKPNKNGQVGLRNGKVRQWFQQGKIDG